MTVNRVVGNMVVVTGMEERNDEDFIDGQKMAMRRYIGVELEERTPCKSRQSGAVL